MMNKHNLYKNQYRNAKLKLKEDWTDWLPSKETLNKWVDIAQTGIDIASIPASFVPGLNLAVSGVQAASAGLDLAQGQGEDAAWRGGAAALGLIPGAGGVATGAKTAKGAVTVAKTAKAVDAAVDMANATKSAKAATVAVDAAKAADSAADAVKAATRTGDVLTAQQASKAIGQAKKVENTATQISNATRNTTTIPNPISQSGRQLAKNYADKLPGKGLATRTAEPSKDLSTIVRPQTGTGLSTVTKIGTGLVKGSQTVISKTAGTGLVKGGQVATPRPIQTPTPKVLPLPQGPGGTTTITTPIIINRNDGEKEKPKEELKADRLLTDVQLSRLLGLDPGEVTGYEKSQVNLQKGRGGEQFLPTFYMTPSQMANIRRSTQSQRAAVPTYESFDGDMHDSLLKHKVKIAVNQYLKSKQGEDLNNHLNDVRKTLKTE
jgi:hypothetical protein